MPAATRAPHDIYSPERPTAVVLCGTGADGAYHAGALRALHEAGVKIDLVAGRGVGVLGALHFAADGGAALWDGGGFWSPGRAGHAYRYRWPYRAVAAAGLVSAAILASPLLLLAGAVAVWPIAFALGALGVGTGAVVAQGYVDLIRWSFLPSQLPTWLPRLVAATIAVLAAALGAGAVWHAYVSPRRHDGRLWWRLAGAPLDSRPFVARALQSLRGLLGDRPSQADGARAFSQRLVELLRASIGQPGHRDVIVTVHDLDTRRDLIFGLVAGEAGRRQFPGSAGPSARRTDAFDLADVASGLVGEVLAGALTVPAASEPSSLRLPAESIWRGEVHRVIDRPGATGRLLEEAAASGIEQVILVSARPVAAGPNSLVPGRLDGRGRLGEWIAAEETAAVRDGIRFAEKFFHAVYAIRPDHNAIGPLDLAGADDAAADRHASLADLLARGHDDAHRLFIEPALGAAGDRVAEARGW